MNVLFWRVHLDNVDETLASITKIPDPPFFVQYNGKLFNAWYRWTTAYEEPTDNKIRPLGQKVGPRWLRFQLDGLEDFYNYYLNLMNEEL